MTYRLLRRISAVVAAMVLVLAIAGPAFAWVSTGGTFSCPSRPTYLQARWQGNGYFVPPGSYYEYDFSYSASWRAVKGLPGEVGGGDWSAEGTVTLDLSSATSTYCG